MITKLLLYACPMLLYYVLVIFIATNFKYLQKKQIILPQFIENLPRNHVMAFF